jgi:hypothetical protein
MSLLRERKFWLGVLMVYDYAGRRDRCGRCRWIGCGRLDNYGSRRCRRITSLIGDDVGNGVGGDLGGIDLDGRHCGAVEEGLDAEVEVVLRAGNGHAEVGGVGGADLHLWPGCRR